MSDGGKPAGDGGERFSSLVASMSEGLAEHEIVYQSGKAADYVILDVNPAFERITGLSRDSAVGKRASVLYGTGRPPYLDVYARVAEGGGPEQFETYFAPMEKHFAVSVFSPAKGKFGTVFTDITGVKRAEEAAKRHVEELRAAQEFSRQSRLAAFNLMDDAIEARNRAERAAVRLKESEEGLKKAQEIAHLGSWDLDLVKNRLTWSDEVYRIFGLIPQSFEATYETFLERVHPDDRAAVDDAYTGSIRENRDSYEIEHRVVRKNTGEVRVVLERCSHFRNAEGKIIRSVGMVHDITERKQAQEVLRRSHAELERLVRERTEELALSEERFRLALTNGSIMVAHVDKQMRYTWIYNPPAGLDPAQVLGRRDDEIWQGPGVFRLRAFKQRILETGRGGRTEAEIPFPDGPRVFDILAEPLRSPKGETAGLTMAALDITERRSLEAQLLQAQKMDAIGRLAGGIAHDFNNMMQVVTGYAQRTLRELPDKNPLRENIKRMKEAGESAAVLTQHLLALGRKQILQLSVMDLNAILLKMEEILRRTLGDDIILETRLKEKLPLIKGDPVRLQQVIMNLALNARDAMDKGGMLILETSETALGGKHPYGERALPAGTYVQLTVSDTGCGMDKATQSRIFDPFFTTKPQGKGTGLGMAMVYGTVRQCGGVIRIYSEVGKGTTFKIYFPSTTEPPDERPKPGPASAAGGNETLLLVEDNENVRQLAARELADMGYRVLQAGDELEALSAAEDHIGPIHLLVTDVMLPGKSGKGIAEALVSRRPGLKTLFISGHTEDHIVERGILVPETHFLAKPFTMEQLSVKIREILGPLAGKARRPGKNLKPETRSPVPKPKPASGPSPLRVLVVDDVPGVADSIAFILKKDGHEAKAAEDGKTALELAEAMKPDVVVLDITLPDMSGYELARRLRQSGLKSGPFIIAASGRSLQEHEESDGKSLIDEYLEKPIDFKKLKSLLAGVFHAPA